MVEPIFKRTAGLDVHKKTVMVTILIEEEDGELKEETREFGTFFQDHVALAKWLQEKSIELTVMESTGVYWKQLYAVLENHSVKTFVVNARHAKKVPGRKTDIQDSQWLASLARFGLLRGSFIPERDLRELRVVARYRTKIVQTLVRQKNRLHKVLSDAGVRLSSVVSDINGVSAQAIIQGLINKRPVSELVTYAKGSLRNKIPELKKALLGNLSERHLFVLKCIQTDIQHLEQELEELDAYIFAAMEPYAEQWKILQTIPGIDAISAAIVIIEIGVDMKRFGSREQLCSWAGICPGNNESAGKRMSGKIGKGNQHLRVILCQAANAAVKTNSQFKEKYKGLIIRRGHKKTIVAIGHKILRTTYSVLKNVKPYNDPTINYQEIVVRKNASRWMQALKKFGYLPANA